MQHEVLSKAILHALRRRTATIDGGSTQLNFM
jgi:hypothetical protein